MNQFTSLMAYILVAGTATALAQTNTFPASGNVGIGTMTPNTALQVVGQVSASNDDRLGWRNFSQWYSWDGSTVHYYWNRLYQLPGEGHVTFQIYAKTDTNYPGFGIYTVDATSWNGQTVSLSVIPGATNKFSLGIVQAAIDSSGYVWVKVPAVWDSSVGFKTTFNQSVTELSNIVYQEAVPSAFVVTEAQSMRATFPGLSVSYSIQSAPFIDNNGNIGIGTTAPGTKLEVAGSIKMSGTGSSIFYPDGSAQGTAYTPGVGLNVGNNQTKIGYSGIPTFGGLNAGDPIFISNGGDGGNNQFFYDIYQNYESLNVGVVNFSSAAYGGVNASSFSTLFKITGGGGVYTGRPQNTPNSATSNPNMVVSNTLDDGAGNMTIAGNLKLSSSGTSLSFADGSTQSTAWTGTVCGGDYAEAMNVAGGKAQYEAGDVLALSADGASDVQKTTEPYSTMVSGIYATKPGVVGQRESIAKSNSSIPMAMVGVVPTKVSAENGPIHRGDLLVSSSTPGFAMRGTDRGRMLGAVIGKAMGTLDSGTGVMEVLVTLQ